VESGVTLLVVSGVTSVIKYETSSVHRPQTQRIGLNGSKLFVLDAVLTQVVKTLMYMYLAFMLET